MAVKWYCWVCRLMLFFLPGLHDVPLHCSVSLIALDRCQIFFIGPFIDIWLTFHVALTFISERKTHTHTISCVFLLLDLHITGVTSFVLSCLPQPFAHDCLKELPGWDLAQDFPVAVCEDGIGVASWAVAARQWHKPQFVSVQLLHNSAANQQQKLWDLSV